MNRYPNKRKSTFLAALEALPSLDDPDNDLTLRSKFNFSYFTSGQDAGQDFRDWTHKQLHELLSKLKEYSTKPLEYWQQQRVGGGGLKILAIYGGYPHKSCFLQPGHIPHQAQWARFRLGSKMRLIGFTLPAERHGTTHAVTHERFDKNTFYVVFLDRDHQFYSTEKK